MSLFTVPEGIQAPTKANLGDAGYDLACVDEVTITPGARAVISTGVRISHPDGYYSEVMARSGLAVANGIQVLGGVIDNGYTGEILVILLNTDQSRTFHAKAGSRVAQLVLKPLVEIVEPTLYDLPGHREVMDALGKLSIRGDAGFGSSGD